MDPIHVTTPLSFYVPYPEFFTFEWGRVCRSWSVRHHNVRRCLGRFRGRLFSSTYPVTSRGPSANHALNQTVTVKHHYGVRMDIKLPMNSKEAKKSRADVLLVFDTCLCSAVLRFAVLAVVCLLLRPDLTSGMKLDGACRCERVDRHLRWIAKGGYFKG